MTKTASKAAPKKSAPGSDKAMDVKIRAIESAQQETDGKIDKLIDVMTALTEQVNSIAAVPVGTPAKDAPAITSHHFEAAEQFIGGAGDASIIELAGQQHIEQSMHADVNNDAFRDKMENLAFNNEMLTVDIHTTTDKDSAKVFKVIVNGEGFLFERGKQKTVPRYVVEGLARAKPVSYQNEEYLNSQGLQEVRYPSERGVRYPFSIVNASQRDMAWMQSILAQP